MTTNATRLAGLRALAVDARGNPLAMGQVARRMRQTGADAEAVDLALEAHALTGGQGEVGVLVAEVLSKGAPRWHFALLRDRERNAAYQAALERAITPGCTVLEIGAGSGLLALMAARAGAGRVITCEMDPAIAHVARLNVAANGYADRISVINKHSGDLDVAADLGGPADILVSEILSHTLLSEGVLPSHADAVARLLKPGAPVIPARGRIMVALAHVDRKHDSPVAREEGFDLSAINLLATPYRSFAANSAAIQALGEPAMLFDFAFDQTSYHPRATQVDLVGPGGLVNGVIQWLSLDMIDDLIFTNQPGPRRQSSWGCVFWPFDRAINLAPGQPLTIGARHDDLHYRLWRVD